MGVIWEHIMIIFNKRLTEDQIYQVNQKQYCCTANLIGKSISCQWLQSQLHKMFREFLWPKIEFHHYDHQVWSTMLLSPWEMDNRNQNYKTIYLTSRCSIIHFITHLVTPIPDWCWFLWTLPPCLPSPHPIVTAKPTKNKFLRNFI